MRAIQSALGHRDRWQGERWLRRLDGEVFPCWLRVSVVRGFDHSMSNFIVIADDITQQKSAEEEIERLAYYDGLTGTPNRHLLRDRVRQEIRASHRSGDEFALVFLDLDQFKDANDAFGHEFGDRLLIEFSRRLQGLVRDNDTVSRLGGDEFVVLLPRIRRSEVVERVDSILAEAVRPFEISGEQVRLSASLGVAMFPGDAEDYDRLLKHADSAMYQAKKAGRNTYRFFDSKIAQEVEAHARMQQALRRALDQGDLTVAFQPQFALADRSLVGVEALVRWSDPEFGPVSPELFIPLAESGGMIQRLGEMVFDTVLDRIQAWRGTPFEHLQVSINVAPEQFWNPEFEQRLLERIREADVSPAQVLLEITERTAMKDPDGLIERMESLKAHGIELSIDDFGTGYSSLAYLQRFPLRQLKIDKSFVQRIGREKAGEQICRSVLQLAQTLGLEVVAEGVETEQQAGFLREAGCEIGQGYLFARPMPAAELSDWMTAFRADR
jgi:diguanylate cyclase (GGDEF)-like protein